MKRFWTLAALAAAAAPAAANDSVAETAAGGIVLTRSAEIDMASEDLFVSADSVRIRYVFRNRSPRDVATTVAFPMPDQDLSEERYGDVAFPSAFTTRVDGRPVAMAVERKAVLRGKDYTSLLASLGLPLSQESSIPDALDRLPGADQARLLKLGLAEAEEYDVGGGMKRHLVPMWTMKETWHWRQVFPPGRDLVVEHRYRPGAGASVGTPLTIPEFRASADGRRMIADYCIDRAFLAGVDRLARRAGGAAATLPEYRIGYILTTGGNWRAPIGRFRLTVDKGARANLVSFCANGLRKVSPTRFEMVRRNWRPDRNLKVLVVKPPNPEP